MSRAGGIYLAQVYMGQLQWEKWQGYTSVEGAYVYSHMHGHPWKASGDECHN